VEIFIENFDKVVNGFEIGEVVVRDVDTNTEVETGVATIHYLEVSKLNEHQNTPYNEISWDTLSTKLILKTHCM